MGACSTIAERSLPYANIGKKYEKPHKNKQKYPYFHTIKENG